MPKKDQTVLFVDDEPALLAALRNTLRKEPYEVVTANSATEGLQILNERTIDVIVSDERMPSVSGTDFLAFVRQRYPDTIRILLTGQASLEAAISAINEGEIYRFLTKPCSPELLSRTLREALLLRGLSRESARLLATVKRQRQRLQMLERDHPGITSVERAPDGALLLDELDPEELLHEMRAEIRLASEG
jgi:DNA-binding NtrC family response regulator